MERYFICFYATQFFVNLLLPRKMATSINKYKWNNRILNYARRTYLHFSLDFNGKMYFNRVAFLCVFFFFEASWNCCMAEMIALRCCLLSWRAHSYVIRYTLILYSKYNKRNWRFNSPKSQFRNILDPFFHLFLYFSSILFCCLLWN